MVSSVVLEEKIPWIAVQNHNSNPNADALGPRDRGASPGLGPCIGHRLPAQLPSPGAQGWQHQDREGRERVSEKGMKVECSRPVCELFMELAFGKSGPCLWFKFQPGLRAPASSLGLVFGVFPFL